MRVLWTLLLPAFLIAGCSGGSSNETSSNNESDGEDADRTRIAFVTNCVASFWTIGQAGAEQAGRDLDVDVTVLMPSEGIVMQKQMIEDQLTKGVDGIAVSPIDPTNQTEILDTAASRTNLITHDSDAPDSGRLCFIGVDNYVAGRMCGELVKEALPEGGSVMIFVGRMEQDNARLRRQGVIDELLDRSNDRTRFDPPGDVIEGEKYTILGTLTDQVDFSRAKANAEDTIARHPDLGCMVGLFAYNPPLCLEALEQAGKLNEVKVVAFDEEGPTLDGIVAGTVHGTVVQDPYQYGYMSVKVLTALADGNSGVIPEGGVIDVPARQIRKDNVAEFRAELEANLAKAGG